MATVSQQVFLPEPALTFDALVKRQAKFVFGVAFAILRNPQDAEEAVQDTFLKLYRSGAWESMNDERAFLAKVAWRIAVDRLPGKREAEPPDELPSGDASPEQAAIDGDWNAAIHRLIDTLPESLRQPLVLSAVEEMNSREIAEAMGISEGTVRTRIMRARQILKQKVANLKGHKFDGR
jgi:RNA polymerase sigma-70 factor (ECF subfamily)